MKFIDAGTTWSKILIINEEDRKKLGGDGYVHGFDCSDGFTDIGLLPDSSSCMY